MAALTLGQVPGRPWMLVMAEEPLTVAAAEQEDEAVQVVAQLVRPCLACVLTALNPPKVAS